VITRVRERLVLLDVRTLLPDDEDAVEAAVAQACGAGRVEGGGPIA
jgi:hypothetical protein